MTFAWSSKDCHKTMRQEDVDLPPKAETSVSSSEPNEAHEIVEMLTPLNLPVEENEESSSLQKSESTSQPEIQCEQSVHEELESTPNEKIQNEDDDPHPELDMDHPRKWRPELEAPPPKIDSESSSPPRGKHYAKNQRRKLRLKERKRKLALEKVRENINNMEVLEMIPEEEREKEETPSVQEPQGTTETSTTSETEAEVTDVSQTMGDILACLPAGFSIFINGLLSLPKLLKVEDITKWWNSLLGNDTYGFVEDEIMGVVDPGGYMKGEQSAKKSFLKFHESLRVMRGSPGVNNILRVVVIAVGLGYHKYLGVNIDEEKFRKFVPFSVKSISKLAFGFAVIDAAAFFVRNWEAYCITGSIVTLCSGETVSQEMDYRIESAANRILRPKPGVDTNYSELSLEAQQIRIDLERSRHESSSPAFQNLLLRKIEVVKMLVQRCSAILSSTQAGKEPMIIKIYGKSGLGKTSLTEQIIEFYARRHNPKSQPFPKEAIAWHNVADRFDSDIHPHTRVIVFDDACNSKKKDVDSTEKALRFGNAAPTVLMKAEANDKGMLTCKPELIIITTNVERLDIDTQVTRQAQMSRFRRMVHVTIKANEQFTRSDGTIDTVGVYDSFSRAFQSFRANSHLELPNEYYYDIKTPILEDDDSVSLRPRTIRVGNNSFFCENITDDTFWGLIPVLIDEHHNKQGKGRKMDSLKKAIVMTNCVVEGCNHGFRCLKHRSLNLANRDLDFIQCIPVEPQGRVTSITDFVIAFGTLASVLWRFSIFSDFVTSLVSPVTDIATNCSYMYFGYLRKNLADRLMERDWFRNMMMSKFHSDLASRPLISFADVVPEYWQDSELYHQLMMWERSHSIVKMVRLSSILITFLVGQIIALHFKCYFPYVTICYVISLMCVGQHIYRNGMQLAMLYRVTSYVYMFSILIYSAASYCEEERILYIYLTLSSIWVLHNTARTLYNIFILKQIDELSKGDSTFRRLNKYLRQETMRHTIAGVSIFSILAFLLLLRSRLKAQGNSLAPTSDDDVAERDEKKNAYDPGKSRSIVTSTKGRTATTDAFVSSNLRHNVVKIEFEPGGSCQALYVDSNTLITPRHIFLNDIHDWDSGFRSTLKVSINKGAGGKAKNVTWDSKFIYFDDEHDIAMIRDSHCGDMSKLDDYFIDSNMPPHAKTLGNYFSSAIEDGSTSYALHPVDITVTGQIYSKRRTYLPSFELPFETKVGLCGNPVLSQWNAIIGLHVAGAGKFASCSQINKRTIERGRAWLRENNIMMSDAPATTELREEFLTGSSTPHPKSPYAHRGMDAQGSYGGECIGRATMRTEFQVNDIANVVKEEFKHPHEWESSLKKTNSDGTTRYPFTVALRQYMQPSSSPEPMLLDKAMRDYMEAIPVAIKRTPKLCRGPLTPSEAINGVNGENFIDSMNMATSAFPLTGKKSSHFEMDEDGNYQYPPGYEDYLLTLEEQILEGKRLNFPFKACLKDEPVSKGKDKTRVFQCCHLDLLLLGRKYFLPVARFMQSHPLLFESMVGVNHEGKDWSILAEHFMSKGENGKTTIIEGDYKNYDQRMPSAVVKAAFEVLIEIAKQMGYSERDMKIMRGIAHEVTNPHILWHGNYIALVAGIMSGFFLTALVNSICNSLLNRCGFFHIYPSAVSGDYRTAVAAGTYGDDFLNSVSSSYEKFNFHSLRDYLASLDITITPANKTGEVSDYLPIEKVSFLKRGFRYDDEACVWRAPIEEKTILRMLSVRIASSAKESVVVADNIDNALRNKFQEGKDAYESFRARLISALSHDPKHARYLCVQGIKRTYDSRLGEWAQKYSPAFYEQLLSSGRIEKEEKLPELRVLSSTPDVPGERDA